MNKKLISKMHLWLVIITILFFSVNDINLFAKELAYFKPAPLRNNNDISLNEKSQLSDYLAYAALNNSDLKNAYYKWKAALERIPQQNAYPEPVFSYGYFIQAVETRVGAQRQKFTLSQMFPWYGKLSLKGDIAAKNAKIAYRKYEEKKLALFYKVKKIWFEYYYLCKNTEILQETKQLLEDIESSINVRYKTGKTLYAMLTNIHIQQDKLADRITSLNEYQGPVYAALNSVLNRESDAFLPKIKKVDIIDRNLEYEILLALLYEHNPNLKIDSDEIQRDKFALDLAKKSYFPDIKLGLSLIQTDKRDIANLADNGKDPILATISFNLPIWFNKYSAQKSESKNNIAALTSRLSQNKNNFKAQLKKTLFHYNDALRKVKLYSESLIPQSKESLYALLKGFVSNQISFTDLINAQRLLLELQLSLEKAKIDSLIYLGKLSKITGVSLEHL